MYAAAVNMHRRVDWSGLSPQLAREKGQRWSRLERLRPGTVVSFDGHRVEVQAVRDVPGGRMLEVEAGMYLMREMKRV
ncbi:hypothetical protein LJB76_03120 [Clostridia bacterium OttesenSCG-928-O13]|nr:hypothetical protein [Clostridia bacterium OttesenSCG-928-O13]